MTEFFKNNPIALHHCLLYEFLQKKSDRKAFTDFRVTVGKNVIRKKRLQFWFNQFRQGKFDNNQKPITDLKEVLRSDKKALRACVLYESLAKPSVDWGKVGDTDEVPFSTIISWKPVTVFDKYKSLCKVIGEGMMEYREFDFWYYRFVNGEYDLDFERNENKKIYELENMPLDVMKNIVDYLNIFDRLALARTSRSLKTFVENQKLFHEDLEFWLYNNSAQVSLVNVDSATDIIYEPRGNDCLRYSEKSSSTIGNVYYWKQALQDLGSVLKYPNLHLNHLKIHYHFDISDVTYDLEDLWDRNPFLDDLGFKNSFEDEAIDALGTALESTLQLNVRNLSLSTCTLDVLLQLLPSLKPGYLTTIEISSSEFDNAHTVMKKVVEMEQWKQAKYLTHTVSFFVCSLRHLYNFKEFDVTLYDLSVEDIRQMKKILFNSPDFEKCRIAFYGPLDAIRQEFGDAIPGSTNIYKYPTPNSNDYFEIEFEQWKIHIMRMRK